MEKCCQYYQNEINRELIYSKQYLKAKKISTKENFHCIWKRVMLMDPIYKKWKVFGKFWNLKFEIWNMENCCQYYQNEINRELIYNKQNLKAKKISTKENFHCIWKRVMLMDPIYKKWKVLSQSVFRKI